MMRGVCEAMVAELVPPGVPAGISQASRHDSAKALVNSRGMMLPARIPRRQPSAAI